MYVLTPYMSKRSKLNGNMRAILVDWLVEVQENFELYHETLYLAVKIVDHYLEKNDIERDQLQLLGATAVFLACKIEVYCSCKCFCMMNAMSGEIKALI